MDARELSEALTGRAEQVAEYLLPHGKRHGTLWRVGNVDGDAGQSLAVNVRGERKGRWKDFATGDGGDLLDLFCRCHGIGVAEAMREAAAFLGVQLQAPIQPQKQYARPAKIQHVRPEKRVLAWLKARGLTDETIADFKVRANADDTCVMLPYIRDAEAINIKTRDINDKKRMFQTKDAEPCLFGWHLIPPRERTVCITEGEFDAMALHQLKVAALSCNQGAGNHQWIDSDYERLARFSEIFLCYDDDEAGRKGAIEVAQRLGVERCRIVTFPKKDANDYLLAGATHEGVLECLKNARGLDPDELVNAGDFVEEVLRDMYPPEGSLVDPFPALFLGTEQPWLRFRPGEVTIWTGINGHGKSQMLGQVMLGLMRWDERVLVYSGEMMPKRLIERSLRQAAGMRMPTIAYGRAIKDWFSTRYWVHKHVGVVGLDRLLFVFRYAARRYGVRHFVVDSLMMLDDIPESGPKFLEEQRKAMVKLSAFAKEFGAHVNLVAHPRKSDDERGAPGKQDVAGSAKLTSMADNVLSVWANLREEGESDDGPDAFVELLKQRNGEAQNKKLWLWFDPESLQYRSVRHHRPIQYVDYDGAPVEA